MLVAIDSGAASIVVAVITAFSASFSAIAVAKMTTMQREVRQINRAVNNVPSGTPPLVARVESLERSHTNLARWLGQSFRLVGRQLGIHIPPLPALPTYPDPEETV